MARVYVANSFKRLDETRAIVAALIERGVDASCSEPGDPRGIDACIAAVDAADAVLIAAADGRCGVSVAFDLGYAIARGKVVYSLAPLVDPPVAHRVTTTTIDA